MEPVPPQKGRKFSLILLRWCPVAAHRLGRRAGMYRRCWCRAGLPCSRCRIDRIWASWTNPWSILLFWRAVPVCFNECPETHRPLSTIYSKLWCSVWCGLVTRVAIWVVGLCCGRPRLGVSPWFGTGKIYWKLTLARLRYRKWWRIRVKDSSWSWIWLNPCPAPRSWRWRWKCSAGYSADPLLSNNYPSFSRASQRRHQAHVANLQGRPAYIEQGWEYCIVQIFVGFIIAVECLENRDVTRNDQHQSQHIPRCSLP